MDPVALAVGLAFWLAIGTAVSVSAFRALGAVPAEPAPPVRLAGVNVAGAALLMILVQGLFVSGAKHLFEAAETAQNGMGEGLVPQPAPPPTPPAAKFVAMMGAMALANVVVVLVVVWGLWDAGVSRERLGLSLTHVGADIRLGLTGFLAVAPPTLALQATLRWAFPDAVQQHEVEKQFAGLLALGPAERIFAFGTVFWAVGIMAPIAEELIFRVLLQGWAERAIDRWTGRRAARSHADSGPVADSMTAAGPPVTGADETNPYQAPVHDATTSEAVAQNAPADASSSVSPPAAWAGLVFASLLFAAAHFTQWPDPIPLFVFSCGLGFLFQRTHRWLPSVVMHAALNTFSLAMLTLALAAGELK